MTKLVNAILCLLLLFAVSCNNDTATDAVVTRSVALYANEADDASRTSFGYDGENYKTSWVADDQMQVLICADNAVDYTFTLEDVATGRFVCNEVADITTYVDAYGVYPATATINASDYTATVQVGAAKQTQVGNSPNHVAALDPLYGSQTDVAIDDIHLQMHHTASVMQFSVKNETGADVTVSSVSISAPKPIAGEHTLNLQSGELVATANVSKTIELAVTDVVLSNENTLTAWVAMSPFEMTTGEELVFVVTTADGKKCKFVKQFGGYVSFPSGKVMEMTAPIILSESTLKAENINVSVDLTKAASYPDRFQTNTKNVINGLQEYELGGYPFKIECTQPYACGKNKDMLRFYFNGSNATYKPSTDDYALIYLPYYENYELNEVVVGMDESMASKSVAKIAIANPDNLDVVHEVSNNCAKLSTLDVDEIVAEMGTDVGKQCCIYVHFNGELRGKLNTTNCNCYITSISVKYLLK